MGDSCGKIGSGKEQVVRHLVRTATLDNYPSRKVGKYIYFKLSR